MNDRIPCPQCAGVGFDTFEDRHARTIRDVCRACGGQGTIAARTGLCRDASFNPRTGKAFAEPDPIPVVKVALGASGSLKGGT